MGWVMIIEEPVSVELSSRGAPVRFIWRGVSYGVVTAPELWFDRERWWLEVRRAPRGRMRSLDREMWRVDAVPIGSELQLDGTFDLAHTADGWRLMQAWDDELERRLFA